MEFSVRMMREKPGSNCLRRILRIWFTLSHSRSIREPPTSFTREPGIFHTNLPTAAKLGNRLRLESLMIPTFSPLTSIRAIRITSSRPRAVAFTKASQPARVGKRFRAFHRSPAGRARSFNIPQFRESYSQELLRAFGGLKKEAMLTRGWLPLHVNSRSTQSQFILRDLTLFILEPTTMV